MGVRIEMQSRIVFFFSFPAVCSIFYYIWQCKEESHNWHCHGIKESFKIVNNHYAVVCSILTFTHVSNLLLFCQIIYLKMYFKLLACVFLMFSNIFVLRLIAIDPKIFTVIDTIKNYNIKKMFGQMLL